MDDEIFTIQARRCKCCGGLLTSRKAVEDGYGHVCKIKANAEEEESKLDENQLCLFGSVIPENNLIQEETNNGCK